MNRHFPALVGLCAGVAAILCAALITPWVLTTIDAGGSKWLVWLLATPLLVATAGLWVAARVDRAYERHLHSTRRWRTFSQQTAQRDPVDERCEDVRRRFFAEVGELLNTPYPHRDRLVLDKGGRPRWPVDREMAAEHARDKRREDGAGDV